MEIWKRAKSFLLKSFQKRLKIFFFKFSYTRHMPAETSQEEGSMQQWTEWDITVWECEAYLTHINICNKKVILNTYW